MYTLLNIFDFSKIQLSKVLLISFSLVVALVMLFYKLDHYPIYIWDEALYANNTLSMVNTGDLLRLKVNDIANFNNSKPPLAIWLQAVSVSILGPTELAIRLPSALAGLGICIVLLLFSHYTLNNITIGSIAVLVLTTSPGFVRHHVTRTGDLDAVLLFFITLYSCFALDYLLRNRDEQYRQWFSIITVGIIGAFLTKSIAGMLPLPGLFITALYKNKLKTILNLRYTHYCAFIALLVIIGFYMIRELSGQGYLAVALTSEYIRYFKNIMPWHTQPFHFYFSNLYSHGFFLPHLYLLPWLIIMGVYYIRYREFVISLLIFCLSYLLIISIPEIKLQWYDAPIYPFLSLLTAVGVYNTFNLLKHRLKIITLVRIFLFSSFILYFVYCAAQMIDIIQHNNGMPVDPLEREGYFMKELSERRTEIQDYNVLMDVNHKAHLLQAQFYARSLNARLGFHIKIQDTLENINLNEKYLVCNNHWIDSLRNKYGYINMDMSDHGCYLMKIISQESKK